MSWESGYVRRTWLEQMRSDGYQKAGAFWDRSGFWEAVIAVAAVVLFIPTLWNGWVYDDQMEIVLNPLVHSLSRIPTIFRTTVWAGSGMETYLYRPLALVTYALNHAISGLDPWSYHLVNVALHALASVLVFRLGRRWGLTVPSAGIGGLIFAVHPVHVEVVAAVFGRKDLLAGLFVVGMALLHGSAARRGGWRMALPAVAYALGMLSKEVGVVGLPLVAAQDWFLTRNRTALALDGRRAALYVSYVATLLIYVIVRNAVTGGVGVPDTFYMDNPLVTAPLAVRLATALAVIGKGLLLQVLPIHLSPDYSFNAIPLVRSVWDVRLLGTTAALLLWAGFIRKVMVRDPCPEIEEGNPEPPLYSPQEESERASGSGGILLLATTWYLVSLLPSANVLVTVGTIFGERLLYLPSVASALLMGWAVSRLLGVIPRTGRDTSVQAFKNPWLPALTLAGIMVWGCALAYQTVSYSLAWGNDITLFRWAVSSVPNSTKAQHKLGEELLRADSVGEALPHLREALIIAPDNQFAAATLAQARERVVNRYLPPQPTGPATPLPGDPEILYTLGAISHARGDTAGAAEYWTRALSIDSTHAPSRMDLGALRLIQGDTASAVEHLTAAVEFDPTAAEAWFNLGRIHLARREWKEARADLEAFVREAGSRYPDQVRWARETLARIATS